MLNQHLEKLRVFHAVAQERSMLRAARRLRVSQPAISQSIRRLETLLGRELMLRQPGGLVLTPAGLKLQDFSRKLFLEVEDLEQSLAHLDQVAGVFRIGTYETLGEIIWPAALARLARTHPHLLIQLQTEPAQSIWTRLKQGELDMIVDAEPDPLPAFTSKVVMKDHFQVFAKPVQATTKIKARSFPDSDGRLPFTFVEAVYDRERVSIQDHLHDRGISYRLTYSVQSFPFARALALSGTCLAVLPVRLAARDVLAGRLSPYLHRGKPVIFGEHRICATYADHTRGDARVIAVIESLTGSR